MEFLAFWAICGFISAYLFRDSWGIGCLGGFILGPIGIVLAIVLDIKYARAAKHAQKQKAEQERRERAKQCPYCVR